MFRGSVFMFGNTEATVARNPFSQLAPADAKYMQAGFTLGGPIKRNKLFFFVTMSARTTTAAV